MGLSRRTRLELEAAQRANGSPRIDSFADCASKFNKLADRDEIIIQGVRELNANVQEAEAVAAESFLAQFGDLLGTGAPEVVTNFAIPGAKNQVGTEYNYKAAATFVNTTGGDLTITGFDIILGTAISSPVLVGAADTTIAAGGTGVIQVQGSCVETVDLGINVIEQGGTTAGAPAATTAPPPTSTIPAPAAGSDIDFGLVYTAPVGLDITGGILKVEAVPGTVF